MKLVVRSQRTSEPCERTSKLMSEWPSASRLLAALPHCAAIEERGGKRETEWKNLPPNLDLESQAQRFDSEG